MSTCLALPSFIFDVMKAHVPVSDCGEDEWKQYVCSLDDSVKDEELPIMSFKMSEFGEDLYIPLSSLVVVKENGNRMLCITRLPEADFQEMDAVKYYDQVVISFGSMVLTNFYAVMNFDHYRVGLANKWDNVDMTEIDNQRVCNEQIKCRGKNTLNCFKNI